MLLRETDINTIEYKRGQIWEAAVSYVDKDDSLVEKHRPILIWGADNIVVPYDVPCMIITTNLETPGIKINMRDIFFKGKTITTCIRCDKILYIKPSLITRYITSISDDILSYVNTLSGLYTGFYDIATAPEWAIHIMQQYNMMHTNYQDNIKKNNSERFMLYNGIMYDINKIESIHKFDTNIPSMTESVPEEIQPAVVQEQQVVSKPQSTCPPVKKHECIVPELHSIVYGIKETRVLNYSALYQEVIRFIMDDSIFRSVKANVLSLSLATVYRIKKYATDIFKKDGGLQYFRELSVPKQPYVIDDINSLTKNEKKSIIIMSSSEKNFSKFYKIKEYDSSTIRKILISSL